VGVSSVPRLLEVEAAKVIVFSKNLSESVFFVVYFGGWFNVGKVHVSTRYARVFTRRRKVDNW